MQYKTIVDQMREQLMGLRSTQRTLYEKDAEVQVNRRRAIEGDTEEVAAERRALLNHLAGQMPEPNSNFRNERR